MTDPQLNLPGYHIIEQIYEGSRTFVYRGLRESDQRPVVLKLLKREYPTFYELVQFRHQYTTTKDLDRPEIVKTYALENYRKKNVLVMEDYGGISLSNYISCQNIYQIQELNKVNPLSRGCRLHEFLPIAIQICQALESLYFYRIIHKDIKPDNILINPDTKQVKLIDFSIASRLPKESQEIINPNVLEGTLAYISPEQTGRMNRGIDYRTDFYSLGVTFYELLTGRLPFQSDDAMELIHCHIARTPTPPIDVNPIMGQMLNDIVIKLMAKIPEERYQSAFGIKYDLEQCLQAYSVSGAISSFKLGNRDVSERFVIPEKLYGRETEVATLLAAFDRVSAGSIEMMLVAGFSGIGKTAVVNEIHKPIVRQLGYFIKGKFDQFQRNIPFSAWVQALQNLMQQLLTESPPALTAWKAKILEALGENAQVIVEVIPELERVIGKQPPVPELAGMAAQNRFNLLFEKFIRVFAIKEHPLVIFLDDLQWADSASLKLMQLLLTQTDTGYLFLIGAYRDNEVSAAHLLMLTLAEIEKGNHHQPDSYPLVNQITLAPLNQASLNCLIADTLSCPLQQAIPLTELVFSKTQGNPFFCHQFLNYLYTEGLIGFNLSSNCWQCDVAKVRALAVSDDVVEFMASQLQKLPINTKKILKLAACIGNKFDLETLAIISEKSQQETAIDLWSSLQEGLVIPISQVYKLFTTADSEKISQELIREINTPDSCTYRFLHDRVQQAAYFLIPEAQKQSTHLKIGQILLQNTSVKKREDKIFEIVNQLNIGIELITTQRQRNELAQLNLMAGRKAKNSTAYGAAIQYLNRGLELLSESSWQTQYDLTLALHNEAVEAAYLSGDFEQMEQLAETVLHQAKTLLEQVTVYEIKIQAYTSQNKLLEAIAIARHALAQFGVYFPETPSEGDIQQALQETATGVVDKTLEDLINLPLLVAADKLAVMRIVSSMISATYLAAPPLFPLIILSQVNLSVQHGNAPLSTFFYACYAVILSGLLQDPEAAARFGNLALNLVAKFNSKKITAKTFFAVGTCIIHGHRPIRDALPLLQEGYKISLDCGDLEYAGYCVKEICQHSYAIGQELVTLEQDITTYCLALSHFKQLTTLNYCQIYRQAVLNLLGENDNPTLLIGEAYNEEESRPLLVTANDLTGFHTLYIHKLILCYLFRDISKTQESAAKAKEYLAGGRGYITIPIFQFYDSLTALFLYREAQDDPEHLLKRVADNQAKLQKWADHAPMNYRHKFYLVEAERHRVLQQYIQAIDSYDRAIAAAKENQYINEEALAWELAAEFYLDWGKETIAQTYLTNAYYAYAHWGAKAKIEDLVQRYPQLIAPILEQEKSFSTDETINQRTSGTITSSSTSSLAVLDLATVVKASQALSGEIKLDQLLSRLMQVALENAGASKGALILVDQENLVVEVVAFATDLVQLDQKTTNQKRVQPTLVRLPSIPTSHSQDVPVTVLNYVSRTSQPLVLTDATTEITFAADPYILSVQPKSVLCTPIVNQGKLIGMLYLENNLTVGAFTPDRLKVLTILSTQAAISIENARLYQNLEAKVTERTAQLALANQEITALNHQLKAENLRLGAELEVTKKLQQMILPKQEELDLIEGLDIAGFMQPADEVGGDYYDVIQQNGNVKISIGDVTGHGLESGVLMLMTQTAVRTLQESEETNPVKFLDILNRTIYRNIQRINPYRNLTLAVLDYANGTLGVSGQHEDIIIVRTGGTVERINTTHLGFPLGLEAEISEFIAQEQIQLNSGDVVVLYTDGVTEAYNFQRQQYGLERLCDIVRCHCHKSAQEIRQVVIDDVRQHIGEQKVADDITLVVLKQR